MDQFLFVQAAIEVPYALVQTVVYVLILYSMLHFDWRPEKFFWFVFFTFFSFLYFTYYGMMCVALTPNHHFAAIVTSACYGLWNLFSGFLIPVTVSIYHFSTLDKFSKHAPLSLQNITIYRWYIHAIH